MRFKSLALIMVAAMVLGLFAGCSGWNNNASSSKPSTSSHTPSSSMPGTSSAPSTSGMPATSSEHATSSTPATSSEESRATLSTDFSEIGALDTQPVTWGPGVRRNAAGRSEACDLLQEAYGDKDALFICEDNKTVYLTFDQGYENGYTAAILDVLKEKSVTGVFFLTGHYINSAPDLVQRMIDEGHVIGNHSYDHPNFATASIESAFNDLNRLHEGVYEKWGIGMNLFRFPEGAFSEQVLGLVQSTGYTSVFWSFAYKDWDSADQMEPSVALQKVLDGAHNGCIFLFHTVGETNSLILGDAIDGLRDMGYDIGVVQPMSAAKDNGGNAPDEKRDPWNIDSSSSSSAPSGGNIFLQPRT